MNTNDNLFEGLLAQKSHGVDVETTPHDFMHKIVNIKLQYTLCKINKKLNKLNLNEYVRLVLIGFLQPQLCKKITEKDWWHIYNSTSCILYASKLCNIETEYLISCINSGYHKTLDAYICESMGCFVESLFG